MTNYDSDSEVYSENIKAYTRLLLARPAKRDLSAPYPPPPQLQTAREPVDPRLPELRQQIEYLKQILKSSSPIPLYSIFNYGVTAASNIIIVPSNQQGLLPNNPPCFFRIAVVMSTGGAFTVQRYNGTTQIGSETMNTTNGGTLNPNGSYIFDSMVDIGEQINFQYSAPATAVKLSVWELNSITG